MDLKPIEALVLAFAEGVKTEDDLNRVCKTIKKRLIEAALNAELKDHLGYNRHERTSARNGFSIKRSSAI